MLKIEGKDSLFDNKVTVDGIDVEGIEKIIIEMDATAKQPAITIIGHSITEKRKMGVNQVANILKLNENAKLEISYVGGISSLNTLLKT